MSPRQQEEEEEQQQQLLPFVDSAGAGKNREYQVVILRSETKEIKLVILWLNDGKAETISQALEEVISEYDLWNCLKMMICDTTNVNAGRANGVDVKWQRLFEGRGLERPKIHMLAATHIGQNSSCHGC